MRLHVFHALQGVTREDLASAQPEQAHNGEPQPVHRDGDEAAQDVSTEIGAARKAERERRAAKAEVCYLCCVCLVTTRDLSPQPVLHHTRTDGVGVSSHQLGSEESRTQKIRCRNYNFMCC